MGSLAKSGGIITDFKPVLLTEEVATAAQDFTEDVNKVIPEMAPSVSLEQTSLFCFFVIVQAFLTSEPLLTPSCEPVLLTPSCEPVLLTPSCKTRIWEVEFWDVNTTELRSFPGSDVLLTPSCETIILDLGFGIWEVGFWDFNTTELRTFPTLSGSEVLPTPSCTLEVDFNTSKLRTIPESEVVLILEVGPISEARFWDFITSELRTFPGGIFPGGTIPAKELV